MKRFVLLFFIMLSALNTYAQSNMTDTQVMEFIVKEHNKGTSQTQIVTKLMQNGVDISQIRRVRDTYEKMKKGTRHWAMHQVKMAVLTEVERIMDRYAQEWIRERLQRKQCKITKIQKMRQRNIQINE